LNIPDEENKKATEIVHSEIEKWLEILVNNVDIQSSDAVKFFNLLRQDLRPVQLSRKFKSKVTNYVSYFVDFTHTHYACTVCLP